MEFLSLLAAALLLSASALAQKSHAATLATLGRARQLEDGRWLG